VSGRLVFIPGFLDDATLWRGVIERLALPGWESAPVNLRGTGRAEPRRGATLEAYRDQVLEVLDELERESARPTVVVGHSMGAQVAELVAGCRPHRRRARSDHSHPVEGFSAIGRTGCRVRQRSAQQRSRSCRRRPEAAIGQ
jgi:pimeloyl-ACP methyl ester carboxylesterase